MKTFAIVMIYVFSICVFAFAGVKILDWTKQQQTAQFHKQEVVETTNKPIGHIPMPIVEKQN